MSGWWYSTGICFPSLGGIIRIQVGPFKEAVQLVILLFCERDAQAVYKRFDCHGDLFRFPGSGGQFSGRWVQRALESG